MLRIGLVAGALVLVAAIYLLPKTNSKGKSEEKIASEEKPKAGFSFENFLTSSRSAMGWDAGNKINAWEQSIEKGVAEPAIFDSVAKVWDDAKVPGISAWYYEQKALKSNVEKDWIDASYRYFDAFKSGKDSLEVSYFADKAIKSYSKVLEINPSNLDAKTDLGILFTEGSNEPMKGIKLLREVIEIDPKHENAQLNLGFLSMKSGQYEKAIERFKKVLEINPGRIDMYVYVGEAYVRAGDKTQAIANLKIFKNLSNDQQMIKDVDDYIATLEAK